MFQMNWTLIFLWSFMFQNKQQISVNLFPLCKQCILGKQKYLPVLFKIALIKNACQVLFISLECLMETKIKKTNEDTYGCNSGFILEIAWQVFFFCVRGEAV